MGSEHSQPVLAQADLLPALRRYRWTLIAAAALAALSAYLSRRHRRDLGP
jgi:hypothetical protein